MRLLQVWVTDLHELKGMRHRSLMLLLLLLLLDTLLVAADIIPEIDTSYCGKRFRVLFHVSEPFTIVNEKLCTTSPFTRDTTTLKCPPSAFGGDGGLTYGMMMEHVVSILQGFCEADGAGNSAVEFEWYMLRNDSRSEETVLSMMCNGGFLRNDTTTNLTAFQPFCPSMTSYNGPSPNGTCEHVGDPTCVSRGPDIVAGSISITRQRYDILDFSMPYYTSQQITVKRKSTFVMNVQGYLSIFQPFSGLLWATIVIEIIIVWLLLVLLERDNEGMAKGRAMYYDAFYWSLASAFDAGASGKSAESWGGKIVFTAHCLFMVIVSATYTGAVGAFLSASASSVVIEGFFSLQSGAFSVVVPGPSWNSSASRPAYFGQYMGGNSDPSTKPSLQFDLIQASMRSSSANSFNIYTVKRMETERTDGSLLDYSRDNPCQIKGVVLGAWDYLLCKAGGSGQPDALIYHAPLAIYELNRRKSLTGRCDIVTIGPQFEPVGFGLGFPKNSLFSIPFSQAIDLLRGTDEIQNYSKVYGILPSDSACSEEVVTGGDVITINQMSGLFLFTVAGIIISFVQGYFTRVRCPYPEGFEAAEYEDGSLWSDIPEEGLEDKVEELKKKAERIFELSKKYSKACRTGKPFEHKVQEEPEDKDVDGIGAEEEE